MHTLIVVAGLLSTAQPAIPQTRTAPVMPMRAGTVARPASWNSDGAPRPPHMWRGHGGDVWPAHYKLCRQQYRSYNPRTDTVLRGGRRVRCDL